MFGPLFLFPPSIFCQYLIKFDIYPVFFVSPVWCSSYSIFLIYKKSGLKPIKSWIILFSTCISFTLTCRNIRISGTFSTFCDIAITLCKWFHIIEQYKIKHYASFLITFWLLLEKSKILPAFHINLLQVSFRLPSQGLDFDSDFDWAIGTHDYTLISAIHIISGFMFRVVFFLDNELLPQYLVFCSIQQVFF